MGRLLLQLDRARLPGRLPALDVSMLHGGSSSSNGRRDQSPSRSGTGNRTMEPGGEWQQQWSTRGGGCDHTGAAEYLVEYSMI